jgi:hypothetical protein
MTSKETMGNTIFKKFWLVGLLSLLMGCMTAEYQTAKESPEQPWASCQSSLLRDDGLKLDAKPMKIYHLNKLKEDGSTIFWFEGHSEIVDFNGKKWAVNFHEEINKEKQGEYCETIIHIFHANDDSPYLYSMDPEIIYPCDGGKMEVLPEYRVQLRNSTGDWFRLDMACKNLLPN